MQDTKLIKILKTFAAQEFAEFEKFADSPYFSHGRNVSDLLKCLKQFYPDFEDRKFTNENIFLALYPGKKFDANTSVNILHKLSSELYKLSKEFLIHNELKNDESRKYYYLLNKLREKKLYNEFEKEYENSGSADENTFKGGTNDFLSKYFIEQSFLEYSIERRDIENAFDSILTLGEYSTVVALVKGFRNIDTNLAAESYGIKTRYNLVDTFIKYLDSEKLLDEMKRNNDRFFPYAAVSYAVHKMFANPESYEYYFSLKNLVYEHMSLFGHNEKYILFQTMVSYCIRKLDGDDRELFIREEFDIYKTTFRLGVYKFNDDDKIQLNNFRSIVGSAIDNGEIKWLEDFIRDYVSELHTEHQENMKYYSQAYIYFERNDFEKALECIMNVKYEFFLFKLDVKNLMFKIYFELEYYEQAYSMLDTMKHYVANTSELSEIYIFREKNFLKYAGELLKSKTNNKKCIPGFLENIIRNEKYLESRNWLLRKIKRQT